MITFSSVPVRRTPSLPSFFLSLFLADTFFSSFLVMTIDDDDVEHSQLLRVKQV